MSRTINEWPDAEEFNEDYLFLVDSGIQTYKATMARVAEFLSPQRVSAEIANDQSAPANIADLIFDKATVKAAFIDFAIDRRTDSSNVQMAGTIIVCHNSEDDAWRITWTASMDESECEFGITSEGQITYTSTDLAGDNYAGTFKATVTRVMQ